MRSTRRYLPVDDDSVGWEMLQHNDENCRGVATERLDCHYYARRAEGLAAREARRAESTFAHDRCSVSGRVSAGSSLGSSTVVKTPSTMARLVRSSDRPHAIARLPRARVPCLASTNPGQSAAETRPGACEAKNFGSPRPSSLAIAGCPTWACRCSGLPTTMMCVEPLTTGNGVVMQEKLPRCRGSGRRSLPCLHICGAFLLPSTGVTLPMRRACGTDGIPAADQGPSCWDDRASLTWDSVHVCEHKAVAWMGLYPTA